MFANNWLKCLNILTSATESLGEEEKLYDEVNQEIFKSGGQF
jgi:hypothetical protein